MNPFTDEYFMGQALQLAARAADEGEIPVGAVVVCQRRVIGKGYNQTERLHDVTAHAEMIALTAATQHLGAKYLPDCTLYVTLEPCLMCAGAIFWTQIGRVVFGAQDEKRGFSRITANILRPKTILTGGVLADEARQLLLDFFQRLRT